jgi:hypothetical protein
MKQDDEPNVGRRALLGGISAVAVAGLATGNVSAQNRSANQKLQPAVHPQDVWMDELAGNHRVFIDSSSASGGGSAIWYANNVIKAHVESYDGRSEDYAMIVCFRHMSTSYAFDDAIWNKYGHLLNRNADPVQRTNPLNTAGPASGGNNIAGSVALGIQFAVCRRATRRIAGMLAQATGGDVDEVFSELMAGAIPNSHFVPAGVVAATRAQEFGYSFLYAE